MSTDLYYQPDERAEEPKPTVEEEVATLKAQVARLVTALQDATDRSNRIERKCDDLLERMMTCCLVVTATSEERERIVAIESAIFNGGYARILNPGWSTPAVVAKARVLDNFVKK